MSQMQEPRPVARPAQAYEDYFVPAIFARWAPLLIEYAKPARGENALDLACGTGIVARLLAPLLGFEGRVVGLDVSPAMLDVARTLPAPRGATIEWVEGEAGALPADGFDLILCQQGLQFFPDPEGAVREVRHALRAGGRTVVAVWDGLDAHPVYRALCEAEARYLEVPLEQVARPFAFDAGERFEPLFYGARFARVKVVRETRDVAFPAAGEFVERTLLAASAVIPELAEMDDAERAELTHKLRAEVLPALHEFTRADGSLVFPMHSWLAVAYA
jgi:SAM-dependent methyltransferase